jgi:hypothetical protein
MKKRNKNDEMVRNKIEKLNSEIGPKTTIKMDITIPENPPTSPIILIILYDVL